MRSQEECPHDFASGGSGKSSTCCECGMVMPKFPFGGIGTLTDVRDTKALIVTEGQAAKAQSIVGNDPVRAAGYRLKVFLLESDKGLDAAEREKFATLAKAGIITKSDNQKSREDKGTDKAIVCDIGPVAFTGEITGNVPWVKVGDVIRMLRYTGHSFEEPPGSGKRYGLINDEDVLGVYDNNVLEVTNG